LEANSQGPQRQTLLGLRGPASWQSGGYSSYKQRPAQRLGLKALNKEDQPNE